MSNHLHKEQQFVKHLQLSDWMLDARDTGNVIHFIQEAYRMEEQWVISLSMRRIYRKQYPNVTLFHEYSRTRT